MSFRYWRVNAAETPKFPTLFGGQEYPSNCPLPSRPHLIHGCLGPRESTHEPHLDRFRRFFRAHKRDQQTDRHTDRPRYSVCSNRPHLAIAAIGRLHLAKFLLTVYSDSHWLISRFLCQPDDYGSRWRAAAGPRQWIGMNEQEHWHGGAPHPTHR